MNLHPGLERNQPQPCHFISSSVFQFQPLVVLLHLILESDTSDTQSDICCQPKWNLIPMPFRLWKTARHIPASSCTPAVPAVIITSLIFTSTISLFFFFYNTTRLKTRLMDYVMFSPKWTMLREDILCVSGFLLPGQKTSFNCSCFVFCLLEHSWRVKSLIIASWGKSDVLMI